MSEQIRCSRCGKTMRTSFRPVVSVTRSPKLREKVLNKELFRCSCSKCGQRGMLLHRFLYVDEKKGFMVYLVPEFEERQLVDRRIEQAYPELRHMTRRIVTNISRMREKIMLLEAGLDDQAVELAKLVMVGVVSKRRAVNIQEVYFNELNEEKGIVGFTFFLGTDNEPVTFRTRSEIYQMAKEIVADYRTNHPSEGFERVDIRWASRVLAEYRSALENEENAAAEEE
jgi:hypothetical protein